MSVELIALLVVTAILMIAVAVVIVRNKKWDEYEEEIYQSSLGHESWPRPGRALFRGRWGSTQWMLGIAVIILAVVASAIYF